jgi:hypothetical protein
MSSDDGDDARDDYAPVSEDGAGGDHDNFDSRQMDQQLEETLNFTLPGAPDSLSTGMEEVGGPFFDHPTELGERFGYDLI